MFPLFALRFISRVLILVIYVHFLFSILGTDVAGEVVAVGVGVNRFKAGDKVLAMINPFVSSMIIFNHLAVLIYGFKHQ